MRTTNKEEKPALGRNWAEKAPSGKNSNIKGVSRDSVITHPPDSFHAELRPTAMQFVQ
jgi:hypothetical protein